MDVAFLVELHKHTSVMRRRSEPPERKIAQRKAFYYIRMTDRSVGFQVGGDVFAESGDDE